MKLTKEFEDVVQMHKFVKDYLQEYAPAGYGTEIKIEIIQTYEEWKNNFIKYKVCIERLDTCE